MAILTINSLVQTSLLPGIRLLSGSLQANNEIRNVNIIDNPESYEWFSAGDFLLTTGYIFKDSEVMQRQLIQELSELNCSGLGIKIKRYWESIPKPILEEAKLRNFPIVEIPFTFSLAQVSNIINDEVRQRESSDLERYRSINDTFFKCSLSGGDLWKIAELASQLSNNSIILLDSSFQLLSYCEHENNTHAFEDYLRLHEREKVFPRSFSDTLPTNADNFTVSIKRELEIKNTVILTRIIPIAYSKDIYGYIVVWRTGPKLEAIDYVALESAAQTAALERIKTKQIIETQNKQRDDFYDDLIQGRIISNNALKSLAKVYGFNLNKGHVISILQMLKASVESIRDTIEDIEDIALAENRTVRLFHREQTIFIFLEIEQADVNRRDMPQSIRDFNFQVYEMLQKRSPRQEIVIGVSNVVKDLMMISKAVNLAMDVIRISSRINISPPIYYFADLISYHLIDSSLDEDSMMEYFQQLLGDLHEYDYKHNSDLLNTLDEYFLSLGNVSLTAKRMYIHRNTIIYRLEKIKEILQTDLKDPEKNFNLQLALKIYRIIQLHHRK